MLKTLRKNTKLIIWSVIISFALWGGFSVGVQFQKQGRMAGEISGKPVSFQEYNLFYQANQILSYAGKPPEDPEALKQQTWQSLLYAREARKKKIRVSDEEVRQEIFRLLAAQKIENPTLEIYRRWLAAVTRETPTEFENQLRELLRIQKLIREFNDKPIDAASPEEAQKKFLRENQKVSLEWVRFATAQEASGFRKKAKDARKWKKETEKLAKGKVTKTGLVDLDLLTRQWPIPEDEAQKLSALSKDTVSEASPLGKEFAVFFVADKKDADRNKFEKELKQKYIDELTDQKKYQRFIQWSLELKEKARLKDYLPRSEGASPAAS